MPSMIPLKAACTINRLPAICVRSLRTQQTGLPDKHPPIASSRQIAALGRNRSYRP